MKLAILGGAGASGSVLGALLAKAGVDVTLVDIAQAAVDAIRRDGLRVEWKAGGSEAVPVAATTQPGEVGVVDALVVLVKCYDTEAAVAAAGPLIGRETAVLTLQNGWGNAEVIGRLVGPERVLAGVTYDSATLLAPGHVRQTGAGKNVFGELDGTLSPRALQLERALRSAGMDAVASDRIVDEVWSKLALNCCTLSTAAILRFFTHQLTQHDGVRDLMSALLQEVIAVARGQGIELDYDERWAAITALAGRAVGGKPSMLQDVESRRRTEIDVVNGAVVAAGRRLGIATPYNQAMVWLVKSLEETF
jgi:2-dehydropantoate 2-reductase